MNIYDEEIKECPKCKTDAYLMQPYEDIKMKTNEQATNRPWHYQEGADKYTHIIRDEKDGWILSMSQDSSSILEANARLIVKAVNCHDALVEAVKLLIHGIKTGEIYSIEDGLKKAEEVLTKAGEL